MVCRVSCDLALTSGIQESLCYVAEGFWWFFFLSTCVHLSKYYSVNFWNCLKLSVLLFFYFDQELEGEVKAGKVDCDAYPRICQLASVHAYPSVRFYPGTRTTGGQEQVITDYKPWDVFIGHTTYIPKKSYCYFRLPLQVVRISKRLLTQIRLWMKKQIFTFIQVLSAAQNTTMFLESLSGSVSYLPSYEHIGSCSASFEIQTW